MEAPLALHPTPVADPSVADPSVADPSTAPDRPPLRVIPGGPDAALRHRRPAAVYRRRRAMLAVAAFLLLIAGLTLARGLERDVLGSPTAPDESASATPASTAAGVADATYRVRPGDTLWSVARGLRPEGDIRPLVDRLADANGGPTLRAGQTLDLSAVAG